MQNMRILYTLYKSALLVMAFFPKLFVILFGNKNTLDIILYDKFLFVGKRAKRV